MIDMRLDISKKFETLPKSIIRALGKQLNTATFDAMVSGAMDTRNDIIELIKNSPASNRGYARGRKTHFTSMPGRPPRIDTGNMVASIQSIADEGALSVETGSLITSKVKGYPYYLEYGTNTIEARPWLQPAIDINYNDIKEAVIASAWKVLEDIDY